jgi:hypothetical protein
LASCAPGENLFLSQRIIAYASGSVSLIPTLRAEQGNDKNEKSKNVNIFPNSRLLFGLFEYTFDLVDV